MNIAKRKARTVVGIAASAGLIVGLTGTPVAWADSTVTATEGVNIRSGPSTSKSIIGGLYRGQTITAVKTKSGWTKVRFDGDTGYISARYLIKGSKSKKATKISIETTRLTTSRLNVRTGPSLQNGVVQVLNTGTRVKLTGNYKRGYCEIALGGKRRWISTQYLASSSNGLRKVTGKRVATADLLVRTSSDSGFKVITEIKKGGSVSITGASQNGKAQIVYKGAIRWVTAKYLKSGAASQPSTPSLPKAKGKKYATAPLDIRSASSKNHKVLGEVSKGTKLTVTGVVKNGRAQIIHNGALRWVTAQYLSNSKPKATSNNSGSNNGSNNGGGGPINGSGLSGLRPSTKNVLQAAHARFPQVNTFYGVRPDSIPDHPSGKALDIMIPGNYHSSSGRALGQEIANWAKANQSSLNIEYIIWDQKIWNVKRSGEGWRYMADRGGDSSNHKNHVHITVLN